mgnify:CR=1 FL=1
MNNLSDLILKCGDSFRTLILHTQYKKKLLKPWEVVPNKKLYPNYKSGKGSSPEDAFVQYIKINCL